MAQQQNKSLILLLLSLRGTVSVAVLNVFMLYLGSLAGYVGPMWDGAVFAFAEAVFLLTVLPITYYLYRKRRLTLIYCTAVGGAASLLAATAFSLPGLLASTGWSVDVIMGVILVLLVFSVPGMVAGITFWMTGLPLINLEKRLVYR